MGERQLSIGESALISLNEAGSLEPDRVYESRRWLSAKTHDRR